MSPTMSSIHQFGIWCFLLQPRSALLARLPLRMKSKLTWLSIMLLGILLMGKWFLFLQIILDCNLPLQVDVKKAEPKGSPNLVQRAGAYPAVGAYSTPVTYGSGVPLQPLGRGVPHQLPSPLQTFPVRTSVPRPTVPQISVKGGYSGVENATISKIFVGGLAHHTTEGVQKCFSVPLLLHCRFLVCLFFAIWKCFGLRSNAT